MQYCTVLFTIILFLIGQHSVMHAQDCTIIYNDRPNSSSFSTQNYKNTLDSLNQIGYYTVRIDSVRNKPCKVYLTKGKQYKKIYISKFPDFVNTELIREKHTNAYYTQDLDSLIYKIKKILSDRGKPFAKISVIPKGYFDNNALVEIYVEDSHIRKIDDIKFIGYSDAPKFIKRILLDNDPIYNEINIKKIQDKIESFNFIKQTQEAKISFSQDSTILYVYIEKVKQNTFDGLVGFETDDDDNLNLRGNVNVTLRNAFNAYEAIELHWKSSADKSQNLLFSTTVPYLFKSNFGLQSNLDLVKQDSSFVKFGIRTEVSYYLQPQHSIGGYYNYASSNYITSAEEGKDFTKNGWGLSYQFIKENPHKFQENKLQIHLSSAIWQKKHTTDIPPTSQTELNYDLQLQNKIWKNHFAALRLFGQNLIDNVIKDINDMYMVGGYNSLRGYNQNSIFSPSYNLSSISYRFIPNDKILFELFTDLGFIMSTNSTDYNFFQSYGVGMNTRTNFGIFQINYALPSQINNTGIASGKVHIGIKSHF